MRKLLCIFGLIVLTSIPALAQGDHPKWEVFGGYAYAGLDTGATAGRRNFHGWNAGIQANATPWLGFVGDFAGHYDRLDLTPGNPSVGLNSHSFMFGPRIMIPARVRPFAHVLVGVARGNAGLFGGTSSQSSFGMAAGGGVDLKLNDSVSWRLIQADYLMNRWFDRTNNNYRAITGVVFRWGR